MPLHRILHKWVNFRCDGVRQIEPNQEGEVNLRFLWYHVTWGNWRLWSKMRFLELNYLYWPLHEQVNAWQRKATFWYYQPKIRRGLRIWWDFWCWSLLRRGLRILRIVLRWNDEWGRLRSDEKWWDLWRALVRQQVTWRIYSNNAKLISVETQIH